MTDLRRARRRRVLCLAAALLFVSLLVVSTFGASAGSSFQPRNNQSDARNKPGKAFPVGGYGEINGSTAANDCWAHHRGEGMRDAFIVFPILPEQAPVGKEIEIPVQILNPWKQLVRKIELDVTLFGQQIVAVQGGSKGPRAAQDLHRQYQGELGRAESSQGTGGNPAGTPQFKVDLPIEVPFGATAMIATVEFQPINPIPPSTSEITRDTFHGSGYRHPGVNSVSYNDQLINYDNRTNLKGTLVVPTPRAGVGNFTLIHKEGPAPRVQYYLNTTIIMSAASSASGKSYSIAVPGGASTQIDKGQAPITIPVRMITLAEGIQKMEFHARAEIYYLHDDKTTPNEDFYNRYQNLSSDTNLEAGGSVTPMRALYIGKTAIPSKYSPAGADVPQDQWQFVMGESSGYAAAVLLVPSLLLGGTYGKASRRFFNTVLGGAKRRVMFHNLVSLGLSLVAVIHIILFTYEVRYTILMGVLWGGLGAVSLLILGLTGYYQVPLIQRHGYKWWRYVHLVFGLLVVVFVAYHAIIDGADFNFAREGLPQWVKDINLSQK